MLFNGNGFQSNIFLDFKSYIKPTNIFQYLELISADNSPVFKGFIKGKNIRHLKNTNHENTLQSCVREFDMHILKRG